MYKKVYIEITNNCNLDCTFCIKNHRKQKFMTEEEFRSILDKLKGHTKYLYFHLLGEPLLHPKLINFINLANANGFQVNITTNGYLIKRLSNCKNIRQINVSLHSYDTKYNISIDDYINNIFSVIDDLSNNTYFSLRFWTHNDNSKQILQLINKKFNLNLGIYNLSDNTKLAKNVYLSINKEFIWPSLDNDYYDENGSCYALKQHIGILVDGTIVPCCLDSKGDINLGNILEDNLDDIINSPRYQQMIEGFKCSKKIEMLCKKCPIKSGIKNTDSV